MEQFEKGNISDLVRYRIETAKSVTSTYAAAMKTGAGVIGTSFVFMKG